MICSWSNLMWDVHSRLSARTKQDSGHRWQSHRLVIKLSWFDIVNIGPIWLTESRLCTRPGVRGGLAKKVQRRCVARLSKRYTKLGKIQIKMTLKGALALGECVCRIAGGANSLTDPAWFALPAKRHTNSPKISAQPMRRASMRGTQKKNLVVLAYFLLK